MHETWQRSRGSAETECIHYFQFLTRQTVPSSDKISSHKELLEWALMTLGARHWGLEVGDWDVGLFYEPSTSDPQGQNLQCLKPPMSISLIWNHGLVRKGWFCVRVEAWVSNLGQEAEYCFLLSAACSKCNHRDKNFIWVSDNNLTVRGSWFRSHCPPFPGQKGPSY